MEETWLEDNMEDNKTAEDAMVEYNMVVGVENRMVDSYTLVDKEPKKYNNQWKDISNDKWTVFASRAKFAKVKNAKIT